MKKILSMMALVMPFALSSCGGGHPEAKTLALHYSNTAFTTYVCCFDKGTECSEIGWSVYRSNFKNYADKDDVRGFFLNENWQQLMPELIEQRGLVNDIIAQNPKVVFLSDHAFVLLKNRDMPLSEANTMHAFFDESLEEPCAGYPGQ